MKRIVFLFVLLALSTSLRADVFLLKEGGKIEGDYLNPQEIPRKSYQIRSAEGIELQLEPKYVDRIRKGDREAQAEYEDFAPFRADTVQNHLETAAWCREHQLPDLSERHLNRAVELEPENKEARHLLGQFKAEDGTWTTRKDFLASKGYLFHGGSWKTQQQIDVDQYLERGNRLSKQWGKTLKSMQAALPGNQAARTELLAITDPGAAAAIIAALASEPNPDSRILFLRALANIGTSPTMHEIARWSINPNEQVGEVRQVCYDLLRKNPEALPAIIGFYTRFLTPDQPNMTINLAAVALGEVDGKTAIPQLIDALITTHTETRIIKAQGPTMSNNGGGGLSWGEKKETIVTPVQNVDVLKALRRLTGVDFQFNKDAWRAWLIQSRKTPSFDARRG